MDPVTGAPGLWELQKQCTPDSVKDLFSHCRQWMAFQYFINKLLFSHTDWRRLGTYTCTHEPGTRLFVLLLPFPLTEFPRREQPGSVVKAWGDEEEEKPANSCRVITLTAWSLALQILGERYVCWTCSLLPRFLYQMGPIMIQCSLGGFLVHWFQSSIFFLWWIRWNR